MFQLGLRPKFYPSQLKLTLINSNYSLHFELLKILTGIVTSIYLDEIPKNGNLTKNP